MKSAVLSKSVQREIADSIARKIAGGVLQLIGKGTGQADTVISELRFPTAYEIDAESRITFGKFAEAQISRDGAPGRFRALAKANGAVVLEGSAGVKSERGDGPALILPEAKFFVGQRVALDGFEYQVRFVGGSG